MRSDQTGVSPVCPALFGEAIEDVDELGELLASLDVPFDQAFGDTVVDVILEDGEADSIERRLGRRQLLEDFDAEAWLLHHATDPANLTFDPIQSRDERLLFGCAQHVFSFRA